MTATAWGVAHVFGSTCHAWDKSMRFVNGWRFLMEQRWRYKYRWRLELEQKAALHV